MEDFDSIPLPSHANPIVIQWLKSGKTKIVDSGCWEWQRARSPEGYGRVYMFGGMRPPSRIAINCEKGFDAMHSCDNPPCCNPWHLKQGTRHENLLDMKMKKRRQKIGSTPRCACGLAACGRSHDCHSCRAIRLGKLPCHCGSPVRANGLCNRHLHKFRSDAKRENSN